MLIKGKKSMSKLIELQVGNQHQSRESGALHSISKLIGLSLLPLIVCSQLTGCGDSTAIDSSDIVTSETTEVTDTTDTVISVDPFNFESDALVSSITTESCTLSNGDEADCYRINIVGAPSNYVIGDFCPTDIYATADEVGIWFDGSGEVYDLTGDFIANISTLYGDDWLLHDPDTGLVNVTDTLASCDGAAKPNVEAQYQNHCVECSLDYVDGGISASFLIPVTPVEADSYNDLGRFNIGVSLNGVILAAPAPVDAILSNNTIAAFDDCAGHINLVDGYHYHGAAGCNETVSQSDEHSAMLGYALDGYGIFGMLDSNGDESTDLDDCRGHYDATRGYHYHAASVAENMFIGCYAGETAVE